MLREALALAAAGQAECRGAALVGLDGMVIEQWRPPGPAAFPTMDLIAAELTAVVKAASSACRSTSDGHLAEMTLRTDRWCGVVRRVGRDYFLVAVTGPGALLGRTRFAVERAVPLIERELA